MKPAGYPKFCQGLTLVELLVAMLIVAVGLVGVALLQTQALRHNQLALQRGEATWVAQALLDLTRSAGVFPEGAFSVEACSAGAANAPASEAVAALSARLLQALGPAAQPCWKLSCNAARECQAEVTWYDRQELQQIQLYTRR